MLCRAGSGDGEGDSDCGDIDRGDSDPGDKKLLELREGEECWIGVEGGTGELGIWARSVGGAVDSRSV